MMQIISGCKNVEKIYEGWQSVVYRGYREEDKKPVVIKLLKSEYPSIEEITELKHEYEITKGLEIEGVVKPYSLVPHGNGLALVVEDFGGESLALLMKKERLAVKESLKIAIQIVEALGDLHKQHIIHKDIKPQNIIVNRTSGQVKIIDFGIASRLSRENPTISNAQWLEGTLAYISPEQTARMNRSIDYRTDFYSLGVTLYEMVSGKLPFVANDALELIHCHIAKRAVSPREIDPEIPQAVADIVMKLLSKNAERRYQSAAGLKYDLEACLLALSAGEEIKNFAVGQRDWSAQFLIPQKLYGREAEVGELMEAFARVASPSGNPGRSGREMMLVAGYSGIGKSSLVNEVHKPIVRERGYFISGKFDQFKRNIPYSAVVAAFQGAIRNLLSQSDENLAEFRAELLEALGPNGRVMIEVIPELELIVGSQPPVPELGLAESQNRFNRVFQQFVGVFAKPEHPLVIFLDDLQWADSASLKSIELLLVSSELENLLLLGAYRDNEVSPAHPLMLTLEDMNKAGATVNSIEVKPLLFEDVSELVADTLHAEADRVRPLAELVFNKTQGNPFFLTQLLETLHAEKLLSYSFSSFAWEWDITEIQGVGIADYGIVELIARNIQKLGEPTIAALKYSACIGNQFDLDVLAIIQKQSKSATALDLWPALQAGLILPLSDAYRVPLLLGMDGTLEEEEKFFIGKDRQSINLEGDGNAVSYKFLHDRVQQAAYSLIPEEQKKETHLKIGKELLASTTSAEEIEDNIFDLVNQLNVGADFRDDPVEKEQLAGFNLIAGRKAKASMAYEPAVQYLNAGLGLLEADSWQSQYDLTLALHVEAAEALYLSNDYSSVAALAQEVLELAHSLIDKIKIYELQIESYLAENQLVKAIDTGLAVLEMLDCSLPDAPEDGNWIVELPSLEEVEDFPEMTDPYKNAALRLLLTVTPPAYLGRPEIVPLLALTEAKFCIEFGHSAQAAYAYALYGLMAPMLTGNIEIGYQAGQLALKLLEKFKDAEFKCKVYQIFNGFIRPWKEHIKESNAPLLEGLKSGLETGDLVFAGNCATLYCSNLFLVGEPLESVKKEIGQYVELAEKIKQDYPIYYLKIWRQLALNLMGEAEDSCVLSGESFDESVMVAQFQETKNYTLLFMTALAKTILLFLLGEYENALDMASLAAEHSGAVLGMSNFAIHNFYYSLVLLSQHSQDDRGEEYWKLVEANQQKMQGWASSAPANFEHKYLLVEAERARVLGQNLAAIELYDRAIALAKERGYVCEAALANELAAKFYFSTGRSRVGRLYLTDAYYGYVNWGALAAAKNLEQKYPTEFAELFAARTSREENFASTLGGRIDTSSTATSTSSSSAIDAITVMKASQVLADEIVLSKLIDKLLDIVMENAGALMGCLILEKNGNLVLKATGNAEQEEVIFWPDVPIETSDRLPKSAIYFTFRSGEALVLSDASENEKYKNDPYIAKTRVKSILCLPIANQGQLIGVLYLENNLTSGVFTPERLEILKVLSSQVAISLKNALLYANLEATTKELEEAKAQLEESNRNLEEKVAHRTRELQDKNVNLQQAIVTIQDTQHQLIQTEKMSSLGQLVAGVAHEINNPVNFIYGNLAYSSEYLQQLLELVELYEQTYPSLTPELVAKSKEIDLEFLKEDFPKTIESMRSGSNRIRQIVLSLRNFSRLDEAEMKAVDIHAGIESTLDILAHRLAAKQGCPPIKIIKEYGSLPEVECYPGQLNQVFMNLLNNGIDALEGHWTKTLGHNRCVATVAPHSERIPKIVIRTEALGDERVSVRIIDNGPGMTEDVQRKVFDPFFTTKPVGSGTGLGLSVSYKIVTEKHRGQLKCLSVSGAGAEFCIEIPSRQGKHI